MRRLRDTVITAASLTLFLAGGTSTAARLPALTLVVHVSNQAGTSTVVLTRAKASADRIFRAIGVRIVWSRDSVIRPQVRRVQLRDHLAVVRAGRLNWGELLGRVIAHELGHLALPGGHSRIGIMTEGLDIDPGMSARFTGPQARSIRALLESKQASARRSPAMQRSEPLRRLAST